MIAPSGPGTPANNPWLQAAQGAPAPAAPPAPQDVSSVGASSGAGFTMPTAAELKAKAHEWANQASTTAGQLADGASTTATDLNHKVSDGLGGVGGGTLKKLWDYGMGGGLLGHKGFNVGQKFWNKPGAPPVNPMTAAQGATPGPALAGVNAALH